jgi:hypothetical protein
MRSLAFEERKAFERKKLDLEESIRSAKLVGASNSQIKKLKAFTHNEWQKYLKDNQIISIFGRIFTEKETPIEGTTI